MASERIDESQFLCDEEQEVNFYAMKSKKSSLVFLPKKLKKCDGKISAQHHTIVKQICFPNGSALFLSLFSLSKTELNA